VEEGGSYVGIIVYSGLRQYHKAGMIMLEGSMLAWTAGVMVEGEREVVLRQLLMGCYVACMHQRSPRRHIVQKKN